MAYLLIDESSMAVIWNRFVVLISREVFRFADFVELLVHLISIPSMSGINRMWLEILWPALYKGSKVG